MWEQKVCVWEREREHWVRGDGHDYEKMIILIKFQWPHQHQLTLTKPSHAVALTGCPPCFLRRLDVVGKHEKVTRHDAPMKILTNDQNPIFDSFLGATHANG